MYRQKLHPKIFVAVLVISQAFAPLSAMAATPQLSQATVDSLSDLSGFEITVTDLGNTTRDDRPESTLVADRGNDYRVDYQVDYYDYGRANRRRTGQG